MGTLVNAIKAIFASKKTTDSNYAVPLLNMNDASPAGYMELPDLAAVAAGIYKTLSTTDLNTVTATGLYRVNGTSIDSAESDWGMLYHLNHNANIAHQIKFCANMGKVIYRKKNGGSWLAWKVIAEY